jgi:glycerate dehydrogenase
MQRIVFLDRDTLDASLRRPAFAHEWREYGETRAEDVVERLRGATIAITNKVALRAAELRELPELRLIAVAATGTDIIDLEYCREHGVRVSNVRGYARHTVPEHVLMLMLALRRNLVAYREDLQKGAWERARQFCLLTHPIRDLHESTLGIVGYGSIGRGVETLARGFGMRVLVAEHRGADETREGRTPFDEVLRQSDVLTLHAPLNEKTRHLIGRPELSLMKERALLINCARGGLVDEAALVEALQSGEIAGAGVDVLSREPPHEGNALLDVRLSNLIVTPHIAWASREAMQALADQLIANIETTVTSDE